MIDFDPFERRLAVALRSDADLGVAPFDPALIARAAIQSDHRDQRRVTRLPRRMSRKPTNRLLVAATLVVGAGVIGASLVGGRLVSPNPVPTKPNGVAFASASPNVTAVSSPVPSETGSPAQAGMFYQVRAAYLVSDTVGWVSTSSGIYRTADLGKTWTKVQPPGWSAMATTKIVDADTMYVVSEGRPVTIAATHDGGATWVTATIDDPSTKVGPILSFQTSDIGSALFSATNSFNKMSVFETTDGGRTWTGPARATGVSVNAYFKGGGFDQRPDVGLALGNFGEDRKPFDNSLFLSHDGGVTWIKRSFPISDIAPKGEMKVATAIRDDGSGRIVMAISVGGDSQIYTSADDGLSWQLAGRPSIDANAIVLLLSMTEWIFISDRASQVVSTVDGGGHWLTTVGSSSFKIWQATFASPDIGWAIALCGGASPVPDYPACDPTQQTNVLLMTTDGGATWTQLGG